MKQTLRCVFLFVISFHVYAAPRGRQVSFLEDKVIFEANGKEAKHCRQMKGFNDGKDNPLTNVCLIGDKTGKLEISRDVYDAIMDENWFDPKKFGTFISRQMAMLVPEIEIRCLTEEAKGKKSVITHTPNSQGHIGFAISCDLKTKDELEKEKKHFLAYLKDVLSKPDSLARELTKSNQDCSKNPNSLECIKEVKSWIAILTNENPGQGTSAEYCDSLVRFEQSSSLATFIPVEKQVSGARNQLINGKREGLWEEERDCGKYEECMTWKSIGNYVNGKREGPWKVYYEDGTLREEVNYKNDLKEGKSILKYRREIDNKLITINREFKAGLPVGEEITYIEGKFFSKNIFTHKPDEKYEDGYLIEESGYYLQENGTKEQILPRKSSSQRELKVNRED